MAVCFHEARVDIYGLRRMGRLCRLVLDEWLRSSQSVCASVCPPRIGPTASVCDVILGDDSILENTVEVGEAELKGGDHINKTLSSHVFAGKLFHVFTVRVVCFPRSTSLGRHRPCLGVVRATDPSAMA